jgi:hypothetical protein
MVNAISRIKGRCRQSGDVSAGNALRLGSSLWTIRLSIGTVRRRTVRRVNGSDICSWPSVERKSRETYVKKATVFGRILQRVRGCVGGRGP